MTDNVLYDTPLEFMNDAVVRSDECVAQSVIPLGDGTFRSACTCERWEILTDSKEQGLAEARRHTGSDRPR